MLGGRQHKVQRGTSWILLSMNFDMEQIASISQQSHAGFAIRLTSRGSTVPTTFGNDGSALGFNQVKTGQSLAEIISIFSDCSYMYVLDTVREDVDVIKHQLMSRSSNEKRQRAWFVL